MADEKNVNLDAETEEELDLDTLDQVAGGAKSLRDVTKRETEDISGSTISRV